jgi:hypothetical protein
MSVSIMTYILLKTGILLIPERTCEIIEYQIQVCCKKIAASKGPDVDMSEEFHVKFSVRLHSFQTLLHTLAFTMPCCLTMAFRTRPLSSMKASPCMHSMCPLDDSIHAIMTRNRRQ